MTTEAWIAILAVLGYAGVVWKANQDFKREVEKATAKKVLKRITK